MVHVSECSTFAANFNTGAQIETRDGTVDQFPGVGDLRRDSIDEVVAALNHLRKGRVGALGPLEHEALHRRELDEGALEGVVVVVVLEGADAHLVGRLVEGVHCGLALLLDSGPVWLLYWP